jgi:hypothetical protein
MLTSEDEHETVSYMTEMEFVADQSFPTCFDVIGLIFAFE